MRADQENLSLRKSIAVHQRSIFVRSSLFLIANENQPVCIGNGGACHLERLPLSSRSSLLSSRTKREIPFAAKCSHKLHSKYERACFDTDFSLRFEMTMEGRFVISNRCEISLILQTKNYSNTTINVHPVLFQQSSTIDLTGSTC
jgi:hypothetical protein